MKKCKEEKKSNLISVGIDVAMETLMICERNDNGKDKIREIKNSESSLKRFAKKLKDQKYQGKIIMESTGRHHLLGAIILAEEELDIRVINPLITKKYSSAAIRKVKTDKRDSQILAEIGIKEERLPNRFNLSRDILVLRKKMRLISSLSKQLQNLTTMTREHEKTLKGLKRNLSETEKRIFATIAALKKQKEQLENELENEIRKDDQHNQLSEKYDSIPGVSSYVASLTSFLFSKDYHQNSKQWIAFAGMDVSVRQSAKWEGKGHLTKRGNNYLRG